MKLPDAKDRKIKVTLTKDDTAFAKTFVLSKTNQSEKDKYTSLDAAVSVSLVSNKVHAEAEQGAYVDAGGNLTLNAESVSAANTTAEGEAEASNAAVGSIRSSQPGSRNCYRAHGRQWSSGRRRPP